MTESKIVGLFGQEIPVAIGEPVPSVIELLEDIMGQAKAGRIQAVGIAIVSVDYWFNARHAANAGYMGALIGASAQLTHRLCARGEE